MYGNNVVRSGAALEITMKQHIDVITYLFMPVRQYQCHYPGIVLAILLESVSMLKLYTVLRQI